MRVCPICQWPFATERELNTHVEIKHPETVLSKPGAVSNWAWMDDEPDDDTYTDQDAENHICPKCHGSGIWIDDIEPCPHCDGLGYEWWH